jgi:hypothetical protein
MEEFFTRAARGLARLKNRLRDEWWQVSGTRAMASFLMCTGLVLDVGIVMEERRPLVGADSSDLKLHRSLTSPESRDRSRPAPEYITKVFAIISTN